MGLDTDGYRFWDPAHELVMLMIIDNREPEIFHHTYYEPTVSVIKNACQEVGLPADKVLGLIEDAHPDTHTMFIDVQKFLEAQKE